MMSADLLTTVEAAKVLGLQPGTLCNWRNFKRGPKFVRVKAGNRVLVRYRRADLESYSLRVYRRGIERVKALEAT